MSIPNLPATRKREIWRRHRLGRHCRGCVRSPICVCGAPTCCWPRSPPRALHARFLIPRVTEITSFLTAKHWTIDTACDLGDLHLLQCVIDPEVTTTHPLYRAHVFGQALANAVKHENAMELVKCLSAYCPTGCTDKGMVKAASFGKVDVIEWLFAYHEPLVWSRVCTREAATTDHLGGCCSGSWSESLGKLMSIWIWLAR